MIGKTPFPHPPNGLIGPPPPRYGTVHYGVDGEVIRRTFYDYWKTKTPGPDCLKWMASTELPQLQSSKIPVRVGGREHNIIDTKVNQTRILPSRIKDSEEYDAAQAKHDWLHRNQMILENELPKLLRQDLRESDCWHASRQVWGPPCLLWKSDKVMTGAECN